MKKYVINEETVNLVRHILQARKESGGCTSSARFAYRNAQQWFELALQNNLECLSQYDYLLTAKEAEEAKK